MFTHIKSVKAGGLMLENDYLEDELKALKLAIEMELKIRKFYISHAKKMKNDIAKKTFIFLANEELKHIDAIKAFNKAVHKGKETIIEDETKEEECGETTEENASLTEVTLLLHGSYEVSTHI